MGGEINHVSIHLCLSVRYAYANSLGVTRLLRRRLTVIWACKTSLSHSWRGELSLQLAKPARR